MATVTASPTEANVGDAVLFNVDGFNNGATVTVEVVQEGFSGDIVADASGSGGTTDIADHATTTLTVTGQPVAAETVTLGGVTYTWRASVSTTANEVKIGASAQASLQNLKDAINKTGDGTGYGSATVQNPTVFATAVTSTTLKVHARTGGTGGNAIVSTETMTLGSFPGGTFNSGVPGSASTGVRSLIWHPTHPGTFTVTATDGTNNATTTIRISI